MFRYFVSLMVTVVIVTMVLIAWTPTAKSQLDGCSSYCEAAFICACAAKLGGNLRETRCEFEGNQLCMSQGDSYGYEYCDCQPDPRCFNYKEKDEVWLRFPDFMYNPCTPG